MYSIRVTAPDGAVVTHPFVRSRLSVGRGPTNDIAVGGAASGQHCYFELDGNGHCVVGELGSRNGTWVNGQRLTTTAHVSQRDRIYVGSFLFEVVQARHAAAPVQPTRNAEPIVRVAARGRKWREAHGRLQRYADHWEAQERGAEFALRAAELKDARAWLKASDLDPSMPITQSQRDFIAASAHVCRRRALRRIATRLGAAILLAGAGVALVMFWPQHGDDSTVTQSAAAVAPATTDVPESSGFAPIEDDRGGGFEDNDEIGRVDEDITHIVLPFETLADIATRYGVSLETVAADNYLNPDAPSLVKGSELLVNNPRLRPLPQQKIDYEVEAGEQEWTVLAERFGVPVTRMQDYNPDTSLRPGTRVVVWIDPKPYKPREPQQVVAIRTVNKRAFSIGHTNLGSLKGAVQLPESPLYRRAHPYLMWGSGQTIATLQEAIATFRNDVDYGGELILSDISKQYGGLNRPHKPHQSGRDIDIWLPTLRGVYKTKYAKDRARPRRPLRDEVDWYALWGLVRALIQTGKVQKIFLAWDRQEYVYRAAVNMGAIPQELDEWIQWPRPRGSGKGIFTDSVGHLSHIHVRFKCAKWEKECIRNSYRG